MYADISTTLDSFDAFLDTLPARRGAVTFGGEIAPANTHRGESLLAADAYDGCVLYAERLRALGAGGVTMLMAYPVLNADFPRSAEYWAFYRRLAGEIRASGLKLHVKVGPIFPDPAFTNLHVDYSNLTVDAYLRDRGRIAQRIAQEIAPDYLSIANEPSVESRIFRFPVTVDRYIRYVNDTLAGMDRSRVLVGAGTGTWDSTDDTRRFARETSLDYIDLHVYPLASAHEDYLRRAAEMADIAAASGKRVIVGEAWLYKAARTEMTGSPILGAVFARDVFSFWAPLDSRFLRALARLASAKQFEYVSPFWTRYLFAYLDYDDETAALGPAQLFARADQAMIKAVGKGEYSATGEAYRELIRQYR